MTLQLLGDRYRIIRVLGSGGFGETFLAEDTQMPSLRHCVIKQLKPIVNNPQIYQLVQERFGREAAILEELGGANAQIPALYAYFQASGQFYLVQEWVEGETLTALRSQGMMSESTVRDILLSLLPVLDYVHSQRMIHRDIKPDNIILRRGDSQPVLIDFGAVREIMGTVVNSQGNPTSSIVIGTPGYMPSEQAAGRPIYSSDLYSLGMTAIYLLTGRSPQQLETDSQTGEVVWRQFAVNISSTFAEILDRAIAYHPRDRYPTALSMLDALREEITPIPPTLPFKQPLASAMPPTAVFPAPTASGRRQNKILVPSLIAGGLIGAGAIAMILKSPQPATVTPESVKSTPANVPIVTPSIANPTTASLPLVKQPLAPKAIPTVTPTPVITKTTPETVPTPIFKVHTPETVDDYQFVSTRKITDADLDGKDGLQLDIMRNWVFASHGRRFESSILQSYFNRQPWYRPQYSPKDFPDKLLSSLEQRNIQYIAAYQDRYNRRYVKK